jgi:hypothetical protein
LPQQGHPLPGQPHPDAYYRPAEPRHDPNNVASISETEFQEIMERNKTVSSSAIARAVQDASMGTSTSHTWTFLPTIIMFYSLHS